MVVALEKGRLPGQIKPDCRSKANGSSGKTPKKSINELPEWVTRKPVVSDTKYLKTATMTRNDKKYKWCTSYNNGQGAWGFHWKDGNQEWKIKQGKKPSVHFSNPATNAVVYFSYLMSTGEELIEEESKGGDDIQNDDFISLSRFKLLE